MTEWDATNGNLLWLLDQGFSPEFRRIMEVTTVYDSDGVNAIHPAKLPARLLVAIAWGTFERFEADLRGEPGRPMPWDDLGCKLAELTPGLDERSRAVIVEAIRCISIQSTHGI